MLIKKGPYMTLKLHWNFSLTHWKLECEEHIWNCSWTTPKRYWKDPKFQCDFRAGFTDQIRCSSVQLWGNSSAVLKPIYQQLSLKTKFTWQLNQMRVEGSGKLTDGDGMDATNGMISFNVSSSLFPIEYDQKRLTDNNNQLINTEENEITD